MPEGSGQRHPVHWHRGIWAGLIGASLWIITAVKSHYIGYNIISDLGKSFLALGAVFFIIAIIYTLANRWLHQHVITHVVNKLFSLIYDKKRFYWFVVTFVIVLGLHLGHLLEDIDISVKLSEPAIWVNVRYQLYRVLEKLNFQENLPRRTALVMIGDDEFWGRELERRLPLKRKYLEGLLHRLDLANPSVIAFDFDLRASITEGGSCAQGGNLPHEYCDYQGETEKFLKAVQAVARNRPVILPRTVQYLDSQQCYAVEPAIFDGFPFTEGRIGEGYIEFAFDLRQIPLSLKVKNGRNILDGSPTDFLPSLAMAIAEADNKQLVQRFKGVDCATEGPLPYGEFIEADKFLRLSASTVLNSDLNKLQSLLGHRIIIVGGDWSSRGYRRGQPVDTHLTPVGRMPGAFIHANYVEALLASRTYKPLGKNARTGIEILLSVAIAVCFAWNFRVGVIALVVALIGIAYVLRQNLGMFFDFSILLLLLFVHAGFEQIREWRDAARKDHSAEETNAKEG